MAVGSYNYTIWPFSSQLGLRPQRRRSSPTATPCCCCCSPQASLSPVVSSTLSEIKSSGVIACLRAQSAELAIEAACAALRGGISVLEIVMSTPGVFEVLQQLVKDHPTKTLGVGTVLNAKDAKSAVNAGAKFLMSPAMVKDILDDAKGSEALYIPGVMTPTEILSAHGAGAKIVKVYPVSMLGGVRYISALRKPFSHISMIASQGITIDLIGDYIAQGASSVVLSDAIFGKEAMDHRRFNLIHQLSQLAVLRVFSRIFLLINTIKAQVGKTTTQAPPTRPLLYCELNTHLHTHFVAPHTSAEL
ncbi:uncharacterized protein LOC131309729 isoform X1 [Rhododendron vialii]|uniref:uncharacterized protein LOC131309729 isoform X1 n=2 Tax=Rhododendron vialii TaxID=182163 RepID=UPI0026601BB4|nr:uncharacterized protein LOC131309729 isoform X1 [Rhododendron vialii]